MARLISIFTPGNLSTGHYMKSMKVIFIAGLVATTQQVSAQNVTSSAIAREELKKCYLSNLVELGRGNTESATTLLSVVDSLCEQEYSSLGFAYLGEKSPIMRESRADDLKAARVAATLALIRSRSVGAK